MEKKSYELVPDADPIISPIVEKFREEEPDFECTDLQIYNTQEEPLFKISDVEKLLGKTNIGKVIRDDLKRKDKRRIYREGRDFVKGYPISKETKRKRITLFFTRRGLQIYLMTSRGDIATLFREFLLVVLDELARNGEVKLRKALAITEEKYKMEIGLITERLEHTTQVLEEEQLKLQETSEKLEIAEIDRDSLEMVNEYQKKKIKESEQYQLNYLEEFSSNKHEELDLMKKKYMRPIHVYLVEPEKVKKAKNRKPKKKKSKKKDKLLKYLTEEQIKELGLEESDEESDMEQIKIEQLDNIPLEYNTSIYGSLHCPPMEDTFYFTLSFSAKICTTLGLYIKDFYVSDRKHYDKLIEYLRTSCPTRLKAVFETSLADIDEKLREIFIELNRIR